MMTYRTMKTISLAEAKSRLSELVVRAAYGGEEFVITAATCLVRGLTLVTHNRNDFVDIPGLRVEDRM